MKSLDRGETDQSKTNCNKRYWQWDFRKKTGPQDSQSAQKNMALNIQKFLAYWN